MTDHLPPPDLRVSAFVGAWERIEAAQKLKVDHKNRVREPLPELYWATLAEAAILADLARADQTTGFFAGGHLTQRDERIRQNRRDFEQAFGAANGTNRRISDAIAVAEERLAKARRDAASAAGDAISDAIDDAEHQDQPTNPLFAEGHRVRVTRGGWAGRHGRITKTYPNSAPPLIDVELDESDDPTNAVLITVLPTDVERLDDDHHCEYDDPSRCGWPGHRR